MGRAWFDHSFCRRKEFTWPGIEILDSVIRYDTSMNQYVDHQPVSHTVNCQGNTMPKGRGSKQLALSATPKIQLLMLYHHGFPSADIDFMATVYPISDTPKYHVIGYDHIPLCRVPWTLMKYPCKTVGQFIYFQAHPDLQIHTFRLFFHLLLLRKIRIRGWESAPRPYTKHMGLYQAKHALSKLLDSLLISECGN